MKCNPNTYPKGLGRIPAIKYLKEPAESMLSVHKRYPEGGEYGWFLFVFDINSFIYWNPTERGWSVIGNDVNLSDYIAVTEIENF